jgi:hypothetical protein
MKKIKRENRIGDKFMFQDGRFMEVISLSPNYKVKIKFNDGTIIDSVCYEKFKVGNVKNKNTPFLYKKGYIGFGIYNSANSIFAYQIWRGMFERCYNISDKRIKSSYLDCEVHKDWCNFQNFAEWFNKNHIKGFELDKDILFKGNKIYSAETCCFVPRKINNLFVFKKSKRGIYPIGSCMDGNKLKTVVNINGKCKNLGRFEDINEAFYAYKNAKEENIKIIANQFKSQITKQCYNSLMNWKIEITD